MTPTRLWLIAAVICVIIEILPPPTHFALLAVAFGALAAAVTSAYSALSWLPWVVFVVVSIGLMPLLVPLAKFLFTPRPHPSNADALIGQKVVVVDAIEPKVPGTIKHGGELWRAFSEQESFKKDDWVVVERIEGTHVVIRRPQ